MNTSVDKSYQLLAAKGIRKHVKRLAGQLEGARGAEDTEYVHQARVASRRLQAALRMFEDCFDNQTLQRWVGELRRITKGLGSARDKDVQIQYLCKELSSVEQESCCRGIARLLARVEKRRGTFQSKVVRAVGRLAESQVLDQMYAEMAQIISEGRKKKRGIRSKVVYKTIERRILDRLGEMMLHEDSLEDDNQRKRHHDMRIACKALRYSMEFANPVYRGGLGEYITIVKRVQTLLGDLHDCDVWLELLQKAKEKERKKILKKYGHPGPFKSVKTGIEYLEKQRRDQREHFFQQLNQLWCELKDLEVWESLAGLLQSTAKHNCCKNGTDKNETHKNTLHLPPQNKGRLPLMAR